MQIVKLSVPVPSIGPAVDVHLRFANLGEFLEASALGDPDHIAFAAAYDRQAGAWILPETPESVAELLAAAGVVLR